MHDNAGGDAGERESRRDVLRAATLLVADAPLEQFDAAVCASLGMMAQRSGAVAAEFAPAGRAALGAALPGVSAPVDLAAVRVFALERWEPGLPDGATIVRVTDSRAASETLGALGLRAAVVAPVLHGDVVVATLALAWNDDAPLADPRLPAELEVYAHLLVTDHERNRAVRERARRDAFAEAVLRHSPAVIARWGRDLRIEYVNDAIEHFSDMEPSWFEGRTVDDLGWPAEARARWGAATSAVFGTSRPVTIAVELSVPGAGPRVFSTQVGPLFEGGNEIVGLVSIATDVTEYVGMVQEVREDRELLATLIDDSPDVILRVGPDGTVVFANEAWRRAFAAVLDDPVGHRVDEVGRLLGRSEALSDGVEEAFQHARTSVEVWRLPEALGAGWVEARIVPEWGDTAVTENVLLLVRDVTQAHLEEEALVAAAASDPLTGLANRRVLLDATRRHLATDARTDRTTAVLYLDIDHFKDVNDRFGHRAGDELLRAAGERFAAVVRPADLVGRQGGDEFIVLLSGITSAQEVDAVARRILSALDAPIVVSGLTMQIAASIGVAIAAETGTADAEALLRQADLALYEAKRLGRGRFVHFHRDLGDAVEHRSVLAGLLDDAVSRGELSAYFQPEVDARTGRVVALEALARWCRPGRPPAPAQAFLELVRDHNVQAAIDLAVVEQAANAVAELDQVRDGPALDLRVNLARDTLRHQDLARTMAETFSRVGIAPERVTVEFDNRDLGSLAATEVDTLDRLHHAGFAVGIDNVELPERFDIDPARRLRVGRIAIIPSVVARLGDDELADALFAGVALALERVGIKVTVVGVEDAAQARLAGNLGIHAQGRWFGSACAADTIAAAVEAIDRGEGPGAVAADLRPG